MDNDARLRITSPAALECRECHARYEVAPLTICEECFGPLEPAYDLRHVDGVDFRKQAEAGPDTLWRYESLLPGGRASSASISAAGSRRCVVRTVSPSDSG